eukprot:107432_1
MKIYLFLVVLVLNLISDQYNNLYAYTYTSITSDQIPSNSSTTITNCKSSNVPNHPQSLQPILMSIICTNIASKHMSLFSMILSMLEVVNAWTKTCGTYTCRGKTITCPANEDCVINCGGINVCSNSRLYCPQNDYGCQVFCGGRNACVNVKIYGRGGNLLVYTASGGTSGTTSIPNGVINCPQDKECNVRCRRACTGTKINAQNAAILNVEAVEYHSALGGVTVRCPVNGFRGNSNNCNINGFNKNGNLNLMSNMKIYAVESFDDINLQCVGPCFTGTPPIIYCTEDFSESCSLLSSNHSSTKKWECIEDTSVCQHYLYPTAAPSSAPSAPPTVAPTISPSVETMTPTAAPSTSPITYDPPYSSTTILYVHQDGCDYGDCRFPDFHNYPHYCSDPFVYSDNAYCCSPYPDPRNTSNTISSTFAYEICANNIIKINSNSLFINKFTAVANMAVLCFEIDPDTICYHPIISVFYEAINYNDELRGDYLDVAYKNISNHLNENRCTAPISCGTFEACLIDSGTYIGDPGDAPWTAISNLKQFYIKNGKGVEALCDTNRRLNVRVSVDCTKRASTCSSLNYTWHCFNGHGGYPTSFECIGNDGNGMIDISSGIYYLYDAVQTKHEQIILKGAGSTKTVVTHTINDDANHISLIHCEWQCHIALKQLQYIMSVNNSRIYVTNGGNMQFDDVIFQNHEELNFIFEGVGTVVSFLDCTFKNNQIANGFNVSNSASLHFKRCLFDNNVLVNDLFNVFQGSLLVEDTIFMNNQGGKTINLIHSKHDENNIHLTRTTFYQNYNFYAMIIQTGFAGNLSIQSCNFFENTNNTYLITAMDVPNRTTISILDTTITETNLCLSQYCLSFINSNLLIDQMSVGLITDSPTTSPTNAPTYKPTQMPTLPTPSPTDGPYSKTCGTYTCRGKAIHCPDHVKCTITCGGINVCLSTTIYCPSNEHNCVVFCGGNNACSGVKIIGGGGNLSVSTSSGGTSGTTSIPNGVINCPRDKECNVKCRRACTGTKINAQNAAILNVEGVEYNSALGGVTIRCPVNGFRGNSNNCNINGFNKNGNLNLMSNMKIYAVESFDDINLQCVGPCFTGTPPIIYCTEDFSESCRIISENHAVNDWECTSNVSNCNYYLINSAIPTTATISPTTAPTISPTSPPTISPTLYPPTNSPTVTPTNAPTKAPSMPTSAPTINPIDKICFNDTPSSMVAWYTGFSVDLITNRWNDISGNKRHAIIVSNAGVQWFNGSDANNEFYINGNPVLIGATATEITLNGDVELAPGHTVFNLCRYKNAGSKGRIIQTESYNGAFGFYSGKSGIAYENAWITSNSFSRFGSDWVLSSQTPQLYRAWGRDYTTFVGTAIKSKFMINNGKYYNEKSNFGCAEILLFDDVLDLVAIECIESYLLKKYTEGPTLSPSAIPTQTTFNPTTVPTIEPTTYPSLSPIQYTQNPSLFPTLEPTIHTETPSVSPTLEPTLPPLPNPTMKPTIIPSTNPSILTINPTLSPTYSFKTLQLANQCFKQHLFALSSWYTGSSVDLSQNKWYDISGNERHATLDNAAGAELFDGTDTNNEFYIAQKQILVGSTSTKITLNGNLELGAQHTIFNLCKYKNIGAKGRIIQTASYNGLFGFHLGKSGVAYENGWITSKLNRFGSKWVLSSQTPQLYRAWGQDYTISAGSGIKSKFMINKGKNYKEKSDFGCAEILLFDTVLELDTIECVENYLSSKYPTMSPTAIPTTMFPTYSFKTLQFGHSIDDNTFSVLYLHEFEPSSFDASIDLMSFGANNGTVIYLDCVPFDSTVIEEDHIHFNQMSNNVVVTNIYEHSRNHLDTTLICNNSVSCYMKCESLCIGSTMKSNANNVTLIECNYKFSCLETHIETYSSNMTSIICKSDQSCKETIIKAKHVKHFLLECMVEESCLDTLINITNFNSAEVRCYGQYSCNGLTIYSDADNFKITMLNYNERVHVYIPNMFFQSNLDCDPFEAYILLDGTKNDSLKEVAYSIFEGKMPCENIIYSFTNTTKVDCDIRYTFVDYIAEMKYLHNYISCFPPIPVSSISSFNCYGTFSPTTDPTKYPTIEPTTNPTTNPTINPTSIPTTIPTSNPTLIPTFDPTTHPTNYPTIEPTSEPTTNPTTNPTSIPTTMPTSNPTLIPTFDPTVFPTTNPTYDPTVFPTTNPTYVPTDNPTTDPTTDPSANPTTSPLYTSCDYDKDYGLDVAFLVDTSCDLQILECTQQQEAIAELLSSIKLFNNPRFMYLKFGAYTNLTISLNDQLYNNLASGGGVTATDNFISLYEKIRYDSCGSELTATNLQDAIDVALSEYAKYDYDLKRYHKMVIFSNCKSDDGDPCENPDKFKLAKGKEVEVIIFNIKSDTNSELNDNERYLDCLTQNDEHRWQQFTNANSLLLSDDIMNRFRNETCKQPTLAPTVMPTIDPTNDPTTDPTIDPTTHPSPYPTNHIPIYSKIIMKINKIFDDLEKQEDDLLKWALEYITNIIQDIDSNYYHILMDIIVDIIRVRKGSVIIEYILQTNSIHFINM